MLDKMKQLYQLQKQAKAMQKELRDTEIEAEGAGGLIRVIVTGEQKLQSLSIDPSLLNPGNQRTLEDALTKTLKEALDQAQKIAAEKSQAMMKELNINIPGL